MIGIFRTDPGTGQKLSWLGTPANRPAGPDYRIYDVTTAALSVERVSLGGPGAGIQSPLIWFGCSFPEVERMGILVSYPTAVPPAHPSSHIHYTKFGELNPDATFYGTTLTTLYAEEPQDHVPVGIIKLASGALVAAFYSLTLDGNQVRYSFHYRTTPQTGSVWKSPVSVSLPFVASTDITQSCALIQHADHTIYFFRHLTNDTAIGSINLVENETLGTIGVNTNPNKVPNSSFISTAHTFPPFVGSPQLRVTLDVFRNGIVLAYQTSIDSGTNNRARLAFCFVASDATKTFVQMTGKYVLNSGAFEIGSKADAATIWFAGECLDDTGIAAPIQVGIYANSSWTFANTATIQNPIYPVRDDFGSQFGSGLVSGFGYIVSGNILFKSFADDYPPPQTIDLNPPTEVFISPAPPPAAKPVLSGTVTVSCRITDDVAVRRVEFMVMNNGQWLLFASFPNASGGTVVTNTTTVDTTAWANATSTYLLCRAYDASGKNSFTLLTVEVSNFNANPGTTQFLNEIVRSSAGGSATGSSLAVDSGGNIVVVGNYTGGASFLGDGSVAGNGGYIDKYGTTGNLLWKKTLVVGGAAVAVDTSGNIYITGGFSGTINLGGNNLTSLHASQPDIFVAKFDSGGFHQWSISMGGQYGGNVGTAIAVDASGNVFVAGQFYYQCNFGGGVVNGAGSFDGFLVKLEGAAGGYLYHRTFGGTGGDYVTGLALDGSGNAIVSGYGSGAMDFGSGNQSAGGGAYDAFLAKYSGTDLSWIWSKVVGGASNDTANGVAVDAAGNIYCAGIFYISINFGNDAQGNPVTLSDTGPAQQAVFIVKYTNAGIPVSARAISAASAGGNIGVRSVAVDVQGTVLIAGNATGAVDFGNGQATAGDANIYVAKYSSSLGFLWAKRSGNTGWCAGYWVATDPRDDLGGSPYVYRRSVYVTGYAQGNVTIDGYEFTSPSVQVKSAFLLKISP